MKNLVFISPNFPENYWHFCDEAKKNGLRVLGIGDAPYNNLSQDLKNGLNEYYKVSTLENYDEVYRAAAFFISKYGRIDWLESNNEYWLERDAKLRTDFHITSGFQTSDIPHIKFKSKMKAYYEKAGIPVAKYHLVTDWDACQAFIKEVSFPVIVKPDNGVGATSTYKLKTEKDVEYFFATKDNNVQYIMEQYVVGEVQSYDAIIDSKGQPIFETGNVSPVPIMDIVNNNDNSVFYIVKDLPEDMRKLGRATVASFGVKSRFIHFEFFRLLQDMDGLGKKGQLVGLEVNMRPSGGVTPDMINFAHSTDVYKIWADMIAFDKSTKTSGPDYFCGFAGRRDGKHFDLNHDDIIRIYGSHMKLESRVPDALSGAMGNQLYLATFSTEAELKQFYTDMFREQ